MKHNYHFVLNSELKDFIIKYADINNLNLSDAVIFIFNFMKPILNKKYMKDIKCSIGKYSKK